MGSGCYFSFEKLNSKILLVHLMLDYKIYLEVYELQWFAIIENIKHNREEVYMCNDHDG